MDKLIRSGYVNHPQQMYTLRRVTISEGKASGVNVIEVATAGGLQVDLMPDAGLDIGQVRYKGTNISFISKNGYDNPAANIPLESEFLNSFPGGLLYTCGMRTAGGGHRDGADWMPFHGRYHGLQADHITTSVEGDELIVGGTMRESALFGHCLELKRTIRIPIFGCELTVSDELTNLAFKDEEYTMLYHCNFGYPFLSAKTRLELDENRKTTPRTEFAATGMDKYWKFDEPIPCEEERVFFHENMERKAALVNEDLGIRMNMTWSETLPILVQWRSMASGDYVCGLEPSNTYIMGRAAERANGTLPVLKSFETVHFEVKFGFDSI